jgi:hypothetical protein
MAVGTYMVNPFLQYFTDAGAVLNGGTLTFYAAGTETPLDTYSDVGMLTPNENPMELDSAGRAETAVFFSAASYKVVLKTSAGVTVATRDNVSAIPNTNGQIVFPAVQNPSSNANTLDDYEEGSWTVVIGGATSESGQSYSSRSATYIKIGKHVTCWFDASLSTKGTITGAVSIKGLPFAASDTLGVLTISVWSGLTTPIIQAHGQTVTAATYAPLHATVAAVAATITLATADLSDTTRFIGMIVYQASA